MNSPKVALVVAAVLGVVGALVNWIYLDGKSKQLEKIEFLSIAPGAALTPGEKFTDDKLAPLAIPKDNVSKELFKEALRYADRQTVVGMPAAYYFESGAIVLRQRLKTPPPTMNFRNENERAMWIPVDTRSFVPALVNPGDMVSFIVGGLPGSRMPMETPSGPAADGSDPSPSPTPAIPPGATTQTIGPFRVLAVGNRLGSADVLKAAGAAQLQENVIAIAVTVQGDQPEPKAARLALLLRSGGTQQAGVLLHPRANK